MDKTAEFKSAAEYIKCTSFGLGLRGQTNLFLFAITYFRSEQGLRESESILQLLPNICTILK